jgi:type I restriction enzyme S subunit
MAISQDLTGILLDNSKYNSEFLAYQMKTSRIQRLCDSIKRGATIKGITRDDLKQIEFAIPTLEVQTQISGYLLNLDKKIEKASTKKRLLEALFNSMLYSLMTGQVRVNNTEF